MYPMANPTKSDGKCQFPLVTWMGGRVTASVPPPALPAALAAYMYRSVSQSVTEFLRGPPAYPLRTPYLPPALAHHTSPP